MPLRVVAHRDPSAPCEHGETESRNSQTSEWLRERIDPGIVPISNRTDSVPRLASRAARVPAGQADIPGCAIALHRIRECKPL